MKNLKRFVHYYKPYKKIFILDMLASFLVAVIGMGYPIITRYMLNDFIPNQKINLVIIFGASLLVIYFIRMLLRYFIQYYGHIMGVNMQADMRQDLFIKIEKLPYSYFDEHETGKIMTRMTNDLFQISELAHHGPEDVFIASFTIVGSFIYLLTINWALALICFAIVPILFLVSLHYRKKMRDAFKRNRVAQGLINASVESSISGIRVSKAYTNEEKELEKFSISNEEFKNSRKQTLSAMGKFMSLSAFVTDIFNVLILIAGGLFLYNKQISFGDYSTFIVSISLFISPVNQLISFMEQYQEGSSGFTRFLEIIDEQEETDTGTITLSNPQGHIVFNNVNFSYNSKKAETLKNINIDIKQGEKIALIGSTGGGKTTICHLIPRFYRYNSGEITIDGININDLTLASLRGNVGIIQQDVFLFNGTIKENILYGKLDATDEEVNQAIKNANLQDFVDSLPEGINTHVGERGVKLSGGQKQRISIARAFIKNPSILILDEATSALDNTTEFLIQETLDKLCIGRTTIVVAHRLSTIRNADRIYVISNGEVKESGTHKELMALNGHFKELYDIQFKLN